MSCSGLGKPTFFSNSLPVIYFLALEGGELAVEGVEDGVAGTDVPLLDEGRVHVSVLVPLQQVTDGDCH